MKRVKLIVISTVILIGFLWIIVYLYYPQIILYPYIRFKYPVSDVPQLYHVPVHREISNALSLLPKTDTRFYSYRNLDFTVPWTEKPQIYETNSITALGFSQTHKRVVIIDNTDFDIREFYLNDTDESKKEWTRAFYGEGTIKTQYAFYETVLHSSPTDILTLSRQQSLRNFSLVMFKLLLPSTVMNTNEAYSFETKHIKGFQFAGLSNGSKPAYFYLFDKNDNYYEIIIEGTQEEIDFILSNISISE